MDGDSVENRQKFGILIKFIYNAISRDFNSMLKEIDLTFAQVDVLRYLILNQNQEINQIDIEREFRIQNSTVSGILKRLEGKGLINRTLNQSDGRYKQVVVTDKSRIMKNRIDLKIQEIEERLWDGFSLEEQDQLRIFLERVLKNLS